MATPTGFRDILPEEARKKEDMIQTIISVYRKYGFDPLETPIVEYTETLIGDATDFNLFSVASSKERKTGEAKDMSLRFDLTVPLARAVGEYGDLARPFKRYQLGEVFRGERPQKGRYRQFTQLDADVVGSDSIYTDADVILMMDSVMQTLGIQAYTIRVNTRKILNMLPQFAGFDESLLRDVLIALDKRDKITKEELETMLLDIGISKEGTQKLVSFGAVSGERKEVLSWLTTHFDTTNEMVHEAISDLQTIDTILSQGNHGKENIIFDMSIIRGLGYYTGTIFETTLNEYPQYGSVYSGGRYDGLIEKLGGPSVPAIGASVGVDRLLAALSEMNSALTDMKQGYMVCALDDAYLAYALHIAEIVRAKGFVCDVFTGATKKGKQFQYAESKNYQKAIIVGEDEYNAQEITIRDLQTREQERVSLQQFF